MSGIPIIMKGDKTSHGGTVIEGFDGITWQGLPVAGVGHMVTCPLCEGKFPIVAGTPQMTYCGVSVAVQDMKTACGAKLIPSQQLFCISV
ncbi:putative Zn-binding protein involved in type VI secretion [Buttiauxella sp. BIGb0471]|uniref:PAAR domain-containing protein n=1 Tax=Buttiauxella sp. BIGb0471 TaxID=2940597 RepID=UPI002168CF56|nr:PAAR domain-containing protein [Buttiauxella sp. BIGb0471]MCS3604097.1 putative Zn-binding protein involved in type VI secretion [Buttiauxella sp. BIGb0471]